MSAKKTPEPDDARVILLVIGVLVLFIFTGLVILAISVAIDWKPN